MINNTWIIIIAVFHCLHFICQINTAKVHMLQNLGAELINVVDFQVFTSRQGIYVCFFISQLVGPSTRQHSERLIEKIHVSNID